MSLTDTLMPPIESWAVKYPPGSSLMFLGKNQRVTVEELLRGMAVVSGNDAAVALAIHAAGSVETFVRQMNKAVVALGLQNTHFEDANGLSEYNRTTARDFARFCAVYVRKYPDHLAQFHSLREFSYPQPHNMLKPQTIIRQPATNTLLAKLDGCDGIKTGFIYESGFNIALTAQRNGIRFIAVILGGAGKSMAEGKALREENCSILMEWAFAHFSTRYAQNFPLDIPAIPVVGQKNRLTERRCCRCRMIRAEMVELLPFLFPMWSQAKAYRILLKFIRVYSCPVHSPLPLQQEKKSERCNSLRKMRRNRWYLPNFRLLQTKPLKKGASSVGNMIILH